MRNSKPVVDSNILVYAYNQDSPLFKQAKSVLENLLHNGGFAVTKHILSEFFSVITNGRRVEAPLQPDSALNIIEGIVASERVDVLSDGPEPQFFHWLGKFIGSIRRHQIFDAIIAYTMYENGVRKIYTKNTKDFARFDFIQPINPFAPSPPFSLLPASRLIPYGRQSIDETDVAAVCQVLRSDWLTTGPKVAEFEDMFADFVGAKHAVAVSSGTAALHAAMFALGIGPGDEVIVPAMTFAATANCVVFQGGTAVFADVDPDTLLLEPSQIESKITPRTKAIIAVDYAGQPYDYDALQAIADSHKLALVADACHSLGGRYNDRNVGTLALLNAFSFHPVKHITTGEGGMITTDDPNLAERMRTFRNHGITSDHRQRENEGSWFYEMVDLGYNYRITDFQCALGMSQLKKLPKWIERRREIAHRYDEAFSILPRIKPLSVRSIAFHAYHLYVVRLNLEGTNLNRGMVFKQLRENGIGVNVHYIPVHFHPFYRAHFETHPGMCPVAEQAYEEIISLPMYSGLSDAEQDSVIETLRRILS